MRRVIDNDYFTILSRLLIGGILIYASLYKILEPALFAKTIWYYHLVPGSLINIEAIILPWLELIVGLALIAGFWYRGAVFWTNFLILLFIIVLASTIARGIDIDCGCFKTSSSATGPAWQSLWFDVGMLLFTAQLWFSRSKKWFLCQC